MDILLFGGAFDPVHNAHINNLRVALRYKKFDKVIIMPTGTPGHKSSCKAPFAIRKKLTEVAFSKVCDNFEVSTFEGESFERSFSYITIAHLKELYPDAQIYFLIGADSALTMKTWRNWEYLAQNVAFLVLAREIGQDAQLAQAVNEIKAISPLTAILQAEPMPMSSTQVRARIAAGQDVSRYLDSDVAQIIRENGLYSSDFYIKNIGTAKMLIPMLLKNKRANHTMNVADLSRQFAEKYGTDPDMAYLAGLLHDIQKEVSPEVLLHRAMQAGNPDVIKDKPMPVLHGFAAADFMAKELGIDNEDLLWAVKSHTCGRPGMSQLEKIVYLADMLSAERKYPEKEYLLSLAWQDLDVCMERALAASLKWVGERGGVLDSDTQDAYNYFVEYNRENGKKIPD